MVDSRKKLQVSDEEVLYELLRESEYSNISESVYSSDNEINVNISSCGEQNRLMKKKTSVTAVA
jgi:hypothetical protein